MSAASLHCNDDAIDLASMRQVRVTLLLLPLSIVGGSPPDRLPALLEPVTTQASHRVSCRQTAFSSKNKPHATPKGGELLWLRGFNGPVGVTSPS